VPTDIVALRVRNPGEAAAWRTATRTLVTTAFASGLAAHGVTRSGWYRLATKGQQ